MSSLTASIPPVDRRYSVSNSLNHASYQSASGLSCRGVGCRVLPVPPAAPFWPADLHRLYEDEWSNNCRSKLDAVFLPVLSMQLAGLDEIAGF